MSTPDTNTNDPEVIEDQADTVSEVQTESKADTIGELTKEIVENKPEMVGLDKFLHLKNENKELRRSMKDLEAKVTNGATNKEVSTDIEAIAEEYNVDKYFLKKLTDGIRAETEKEIEAKVASRLKPIEEKERTERIDKIFTQHFAAAMEQLPEYKEVVNPTIIKTLSLNPANADKTFLQIIEETYGNAITGKRTIETTSPGGGKEPENLDYQRAVKDGDYFKQVMSNPKLKKEYNDQMLKSGF